MQKTAGMGNAVGIHIRLRHNIRIDIYQQHTKCNRHKQKGLVTFFNCQKQEYTGHDNHHVIAPFQIKECCLIYQI